MRLYYSETFVCMSLYYSDTSSSQSSNPTKHHSYISVVYMHVSSSSHDMHVYVIKPYQASFIYISSVHACILLLT